MFAHSKAADLCQTKASKALQEARAETERVLAEADCLKVALKIQAAEVGHLQEALRRVEEALARLKVALTLSEDKRKKVEEEVNTESEKAIEAFKSSKAMEDIKIAFAQEAFLEGFEICMRRVTKNFSKVDLNLLTNEPSDEAGPSNTGADIGAISPTVKPSPRFLKLLLQCLNLLRSQRWQRVLQPCLLLFLLRSRIFISCTFFFSPFNVYKSF